MIRQEKRPLIFDSQNCRLFETISQPFEETPAQQQTFNLQFFEPSSNIFKGQEIRRYPIGCRQGRTPRRIRAGEEGKARTVYVLWGEA